MSQLKITLEVLYDLLRNEKKRDDLQKLDANFYADVVQYLQEKKAILDKQDKNEELFGAVEREKLQGELRSIKRIIREMYEKREKKIMEIALNRSRTGSEIIDTSAMLVEERLFYEKMLVILDSQRRGVLHSLLRAEIPAISELVPGEDKDMPSTLSGRHEEDIDDEEKEGEERQETESGEGAMKANIAYGGSEDEKETNGAAGKEQNSKTMNRRAIADETNEGGVVESGKSRVKVTVPIPSFVWKDMKEYGPFEAGEETTIYSEIADLLVRKGRAKKID